ncbi:DUF4055 domain-containing protein [Paracoccaceae bacterium]|nr:DUF4055 domain-containing protein [Paracoccaceae bacterium]
MAQLTKPTKSVKRSVADPSASYHSMKPLWKRSRAVLQGQDNVKAHDEYLEAEYKNLLIPFSPSMSQKQYDFYRSESELPGLTAQYCKVLISALLRKDSHLELPEELPDDAKQWLKNDFTLDGRSLFNFLDNALWEELQTSRAWVYVDRPQVSEQEYDNLTPEERAMIKPYPVVIEAENVINIQLSTHPITRQKTLTRWVTRYLVEKYKPENPWHPDYVDTVCDHYIDESGRLVLDYYEHPDTNNEIKVLNGDISQEYKESVSEIGFTKVNTVYPTMFGERLMRIPAWPLNGQYEPVEPVLMPLVDREVSLYNKVSRRNHLLYGAATYTPVVQSDMTDEEFDDIVNAGLGTWLRVRKDESITVLETPTSALADMEKAIQGTVEEMAKMGIRMLSPEQAASGVALEIRNASQTAQLGTLNAKVSGTIREVMAFMLNWYYNTMYTGDDIEFQMSSDFSPIVGGEGAMRLVSEWYQSGIISRSTWINIAKYNDFLPADYSDEEAIEEIQTDPLAVQTNVDPQIDIEE